MDAKIILPPLELLDRAAHRLVEQAGGDVCHMNALNKALWHLQSGIEIRSTAGGFLIPSGTRAGIIHRVSTVNGCNCERGRTGWRCWHSAAIAILEDAQRYGVPALITEIKSDLAAMDARAAAAEDRLIAQIETIVPSLGERLARARTAAYAKAAAEMNELF